MSSRWRFYAVNVVVTMATLLLFLLAWEALVTWQRVNTLWTWANQVQAQAQTAQGQAARPQPTPTYPESHQ